MYIGKIKVTNSWQKLEDLVKSQVSGQSSFSFADGHIYQLQGESDFGIRLCNASAKPTDLSVGEVMRGTKTTQYEKESGADLYVKTFENNAAEGLLHLSEIGGE